MPTGLNACALSCVLMSVFSICRLTSRHGQLRQSGHCSRHIRFALLMLLLLMVNCARRPRLLAFELLAQRGALILDHSESYEGIFDEIRKRNCRKVDFFGFSPGVSLRHCTSLVFVEDCFLLSPEIQIPMLDIMLAVPPPERKTRLFL